MRKLTLITLLLFVLSSCSDDEASNERYKSKAVILGRDLRYCICFCGGYFIKIDTIIYRSVDEGFLEKSLELQDNDFPHDVYLDWQPHGSDEGCRASDLIDVIRIKSAND